MPESALARGTHGPRRADAGMTIVFAGHASSAVGQFAAGEATQLQRLTDKSGRLIRGFVLPEAKDPPAGLN